MKFKPTADTRELYSPAPKAMLLYPGPGPIFEPKITNREFLESLVSFGCWFRVMAANDNRVTLSDVNSTPLQCFSAITSFYQHIGMFMEDVITALVTWPVWARDQGVYLADLNERLVLSPGHKPKSKTKPYHEEVIDSFLSTTNRVRVNPGDYLDSIMQMSDASLLHLLGIPWKQFPSVKLVPRRLWKAWNAVHESITTLRSLLNDKSELIVLCYNKLKHGPQAVVSGIRTPLCKRGITFQDSDDAEYVRLLFSGADTQKKDNPFIAPFLLHDSLFVNSIYYHRFLILAIHFWNLASWLLCVHYTKEKLEVADKLLKRIIEEAGVWEDNANRGDRDDKLPKSIRLFKIC